jgi:two-component sensor histidine kinase
MAIVHETLYRTEDFARIDLPGYVESLCRHLLRSYGMEPRQVELHLDVRVASLDLERAIPFGLIVNELVSNALKYAFPDGRRGRVSLLLDGPTEGNYTLAIRDDGVGLPERLDVEQTESLGLHLVQMLVSQLQGTLAVQRNPGTCFSITFHA